MRRDQLERLAHVTGQGEPDRVLDALGGEPVDQPVRVPGAIDPDQHLFARPVACLFR